MRVLKCRSLIWVSVEMNLQHLDTIEMNQVRTVFQIIYFKSLNMFLIFIDGGRQSSSTSTDSGLHIQEKIICDWPIKSLSM
jgi:hypothetical protein